MNEPTGRADTMEDFTVRRFLFLASLFLGCSLAWAQTPTLVQHVTCPNSGGAGSGAGAWASGTTPNQYQCPLPEPSQSGNTLILALFSNNNGSPKWTISDDHGNSWTLAASTTDSGGNIVAVYYAQNVAAGTRMLAVTSSSGTEGYEEISASEYYNLGSLDAKTCSTGSGMNIASGSVTPSAAGDLLWQFAANSSSSSVSSFSPGSQSGITWQLNGASVHDGDAVQAGVYSSAAAINPTFSSGTSESFDSCAIAFKAASSGNAPTQAFRIVHMLHEQLSVNESVPAKVEFPASGNLEVVSFIAGGNTISGITSTPANTWTATGALESFDSVVSQIYYAANATPSDVMTLSIGQSGGLSGSTFMLYDFTGAATSPFDVDSGGQSGNQVNIVTSLTSCNSCFTPSAANEAIVGNIGNTWCTVTGITAPSGALLDVAVDTANSVSGPENVDQNNGWFHFYDPNTNPLSVTWTYACGTNPQAAWSGRVAAFKPAPQNRPLPPTGLTGTVVPQG